MHNGVVRVAIPRGNQGLLIVVVVAAAWTATRGYCLAATLVVRVPTRRNIDEANMISLGLQEHCFLEDSRLFRLSLFLSFCCQLSTFH